MIEHMGLSNPNYRTKKEISAFSVYLSILLLVLHIMGVIDTLSETPTTLYKFFEMTSILCNNAYPVHVGIIGLGLML